MKPNPENKLNQSNKSLNAPIENEFKIENTLLSTVCFSLFFYFFFFKAAKTIKETHKKEVNSFERNEETLYAKPLTPNNINLQQNFEENFEMVDENVSHYIQLPSSNSEFKKSKYYSICF